MTLLLFLDCTRKPWKPLNKAEASGWMLKDSTQDVIVWGLCQIYDPYQGGKVTKADSGRMKILEFHRNGKFRIVEREGESKGNWKINQPKTELLFQFDNIQGRKPAKRSLEVNQVSQIRKITQDTLILAWQGRHGYVEELYTQECAEHADS